MIKICSELIILPLKIISQESLKKGKSPEIWKKAYVVPGHKKEDKTFLVKIIVRLVYQLSLSKFLKD